MRLLSALMRTAVLCAVISSTTSIPAHAADAEVRVWQMHEITLNASAQYENPYQDVTCWVELTGPGFSQRVYGFWDGGRVFRVRVVAAAPGAWQWRSGSNKPDDSGLNGKVGSFRATAWTEAELQQNPLRRGFLRSTPNGRGLQHADGTPFFLVGDTWLGAATWRLPFVGKPADPNYEPASGITFEQAVAYRKRQGFNSISMISAFPNWASDHHPHTYSDSRGVPIRGGWEKFGVTVEGGRLTVKDMHDERGYRPFELVPMGEGLSNFDRIVPEYFQSLDKKIQHLNEQGFIAMLETVRRDVTAAWGHYFAFNESYSRFVQYIASRYGAFNLIFSRIHLDIIAKNSLSAAQFNEALTHHHKEYGRLPFGQPVSALVEYSTLKLFGHGTQSPWLTLHSVGNRPRNHGSAPYIEEMFKLDSPYPVINLEPYYVGWEGGPNRPTDYWGNRESPPANSDRDNYFSRAQMYGSVLSGALSGHVHGHGAYDVTTTGEPAGIRPYFWDALRFRSAEQMQWLQKFVLSEGPRYLKLQLGSEEIVPKRAPGSQDLGLDGWSYMMRTPEKDLFLMYFEHRALRATIQKLKPGRSFRFTWYDPRAGKWLDSMNIRADDAGTLKLPTFPDAADVALLDWAAKMVPISN